MQGAGVSDPEAAKISEHLFPGLITFQRLTVAARAPEIDIEIDSDSISEKLEHDTVSAAGKSISKAKLLGWAYEAYRKQQFSGSPKLGNGGIRALADAKSRAIQVADVFGNFALSYIFVQLGHTSKTRVIKADILARVFGNEIAPGPITSATRLSGPTTNDIELTQPGGFTLRIGT